MGDLRRTELAGSCRALGIDDKRCVALDHADLQDNPKVWWNTDLIAGIVHDHVQKWEVDAVGCSFSFFLRPHLVWSCCH